MRNAGAWVSSRVFSIPLVSGAASRSPGLVVFECTPLYGADDEIEKCIFFQTRKKWELVSHRNFCVEKYGVLDGCARLREVTETFPDDQHFIPSVLFILRRYRMICDTRYVAARCEPTAALTRDRPTITRRKVPQDPMRHFLCHQKQRT